MADRGLAYIGGLWGWCRFDPNSEQSQTCAAPTTCLGCLGACFLRAPARLPLGQLLSPSSILLKILPPRQPHPLEPILPAPSSFRPHARSCRAYPQSCT